MFFRSARARGRQACWNYLYHPKPLVPRLLNFASWIPVMIWFQFSVLQITQIDGESMYPTFNSNPHETSHSDWVVTYRLRPQENLARGMIITLRSPSHPEVTATKRIVGLEGDVIRTRPYFPDRYVQVPQGHVWVEGDAGDRSLDSNTYGPVSIALITGRITHIISPWRKAGRIRWWEHASANRDSFDDR